MHRLAVLAASTLAVSGCSWAFSRPPQRPSQQSRHYASAPCRPGYVAPVIDTWQAVGSGILTLYMLGHMSGSEADTFGALAAVTAGSTAVWGASASYGFKQARACRELRAELARTAPAPMWIAPGVPAEPPIAPSPQVEPPIIIEHDVDVDDEQIEVRTRVRRSTHAR